MGQVEAGVVDEEVEHRLPEVLVFQGSAEASSDHGPGELFAAAQAPDLGPPQRCEDAEVVGCLAEQVGHRPGETEGQSGPADVAAKAQVLVPAVLWQAL